MLKHLGLWSNGKSIKQEHRKSLYKALELWVSSPSLEKKKKEKKGWAKLSL